MTIDPDWDYVFGKDAAVGTHARCNVRRLVEERVENYHRPEATREEKQCIVSEIIDLVLVENRGRFQLRQPDGTNVVAASADVRSHLQTMFSGRKARESLEREASKKIQHGTTVEVAVQMNRRLLPPVDASEKIPSIEKRGTANLKPNQELSSTLPSRETGIATNQAVAREGAATTHSTPVSPLACISHPAVASKIKQERHTTEAVEQRHQTITNAIQTRDSKDFHCRHRDSATPFSQDHGEAPARRNAAPPATGRVAAMTTSPSIANKENHDKEGKLQEDLPTALDLPDGFGIAWITMACQVCKSSFKVHIIDLPDFECPICYGPDKHPPRRVKSGKNGSIDARIKDDGKGRIVASGCDRGGTSGGDSGRNSGTRVGSKSSEQGVSNPSSARERIISTEITPTNRLESTLLKLVAKSCLVRSCKDEVGDRTKKDTNTPQGALVARRSSPTVVEATSSSSSSNKKRAETGGTTTRGVAIAKPAQKKNTTSAGIEQVYRLIDERMELYLNSPIKALDSTTTRTSTSRLGIIADLLSILKQRGGTFQLQGRDGKMYTGSDKVSQCLVAHLFFERSKKLRASGDAAAVGTTTYTSTKNKNHDSSNKRRPPASSRDKKKPAMVVPREIYVPILPIFGGAPDTTTTTASTTTSNNSTAVVKKNGCTTTATSTSNTNILLDDKNLLSITDTTRRATSSSQTNPQDTIAHPEKATDISNMNTSRLSLMTTTSDAAMTDGPAEETVLSSVAAAAAAAQEPTRRRGSDDYTGTNNTTHSVLKRSMSELQILSSSPSPSSMDQEGQPDKKEDDLQTSSSVVVRPTKRRCKNDEEDNII